MVHTRIPCRSSDGGKKELRVYKEGVVEADVILLVYPGSSCSFSTTHSIQQTTELTRIVAIMSTQTQSTTKLGGSASNVVVGKVAVRLIKYIRLSLHPKLTPFLSILSMDL